MAIRRYRPGEVVPADYKEQRIPQYKGNPLIEALPVAPSDDDLYDALDMHPAFDPEQRSWTNHERMQMLVGLQRLLVPMERHIELTRSLDALMREGYVGRAPCTAEHVSILNKLHQNRQEGRAFSPASFPSEVQLSSALIGPSGCGKTTTIKLWATTLPPVIYHPTLNVRQIPLLPVQTPSDGASQSGLATDIIRKIDHLIPDGQYFERYVLRGNPSVPKLLSYAALLMSIHCVGLLIPDEIQHLANAPKNKQSLMSLLVAASNDLQVPLICVGTNKAKDVLGINFSGARRSTGFGLSYWERFVMSDDVNAPGDWEAFLRTLWRYQWTRIPVKLTPYFESLVYHHTQGIPDLAIKLFASCQWRAILDGTEKITPMLISGVAEKYLAPVEPMIEALRSGNKTALEQYDDVGPLDLGVMFKDDHLHFEGRRNRGASVRPGDETFVPRLVASLTALGVESDDAEHLAKSIEIENKVGNVLDGTDEALARLKRPRPLKALKDGESSTAEPELPPQDFRNATLRAKRDKTTAFVQLEKMGAHCDLNRVLQL